MKPIKVKNVKFFKPVHPKKEQFSRCEVSGSKDVRRKIREIYLIQGVGVIVNAFCYKDNAPYQFVVPMNNLEAIMLVDVIKFDNKEVSKSKKN